MPRPATGLLYPFPIKTKVTAAHLDAWDKLMEVLNLDSAKTLRALVLALLDESKCPTLLRVAGLSTEQLDLLERHRPAAERVAKAKKGPAKVAKKGPALKVPKPGRAPKRVRDAFNLRK